MVAHGPLGPTLLRKLCQVSSKPTPYIKPRGCPLTSPGLSALDAAKHERAINALGAGA